MNLPAETSKIRFADEKRKDEYTRRADEPSRGAVSFVAATTTITTYPTTASSYYAMTSLDVSGTESEGSTGTTTPLSGDPFFAFNLGSAVPPPGTPSMVTSVKFRFVFRFDG